MKIRIKEVTQGRWAIYLVTSMGASAGKTMYASASEAEKAARGQYPDGEIEVIR